MANTKKTTKKASMLKLLKNDKWLRPYSDAIEGRHKYAESKLAELTGKGKQTLSEVSSGYLYYGLHRTEKGWVMRVGSHGYRHLSCWRFQQLARRREVRLEAYQEV